MKSYLLSIFLIALTILTTGCSKKDFQLGNISLPKLNLPNLSSYKVDANLPIPQNIDYRSSMSEVVLQWDPLNNKEIAGYRIFRRLPSQKKPELIGTKSNRSSNHFVDNKLEANNSYIYSISSFTKDGRVSHLSVEKAAQTIAGLRPVNNLKTKNNLPHSIKLIWDIHPQNSLIQEYIIKRSSDLKSWEKIGTLYDSLSVEYFDYDIINGKKYAYTVIAKSFDGIYSPPSQVVSGTAKPLPLAPTMVMATSDIPKKIKLSWKDPNIPTTNSKIVGYNVYTSLYKDTLFSKHTTVTTPYYIDPVKTDSQTIYYKITAVDSDGLESPKAKKSISGNTKAHPPKPIINSTTIQGGKVIVRWTQASNDIKSYYIIKRYWDGVIYKKVKITGIKGNIFVDPKIKLGKSYKYSVVGVDSDGIDTDSSREVEINVQ